ncbi:MAG: OmpA family protein [Gemmatimonadetes bacterium]|nr:OmpA family protein [Gemmatimonadota bacterium]
MVGIAVGCLLAGSPLFAQEEETPVRIDYLTFAQGAISLAIGGPGAEVERPPHHHHQLHWIDGNPLPRGFIATSDLDISTEFTYQLPALTTFDRLAVPNVLEVPSPGTTFTRYVEVHGSSVGHDEGYELLASGELSTHQRRGEVTELTIAATPAVRWVKLVLRGGIENLNPDQMGFEFSEIIGNGTQEPKPFAENFTGAWSGRREANIELVQDGPVVTGCYDRQGLLEGTIDGNLLRAHGVDQGRAKTPSVFILTVLDNGRLTGVRSTNGGPFGIYTGPPVDDVENLDCLTPPQPLGCGSTVYGISFDFDSATINTESEEVLSKLYEGLSGDESAEILIKGHTSSEGSDSYNQALSERRAQAVVDDMVRRGIEAGRMRAVGIGEGEPIASNDDEAGRSLNRRVEIECR